MAPGDQVLGLSLKVDSKMKEKLKRGGGPQEQ